MGIPRLISVAAAYRGSIIKLFAALVFIGASVIPGIKAESASPPAAIAAQNAQPAPVSPNLDHGRLIATKGMGCNDGQACFPCFTCHGTEGAGDVSGHFPRLTKQGYDYLYGSLSDFASGARQNAVMQAVASKLDAQAMRDVAAYFASVTPDTTLKAQAAQAMSHPDPQTIINGGVLAAVGDMSRGIQACANCHGPHGAGLPPSYPYLAGQYADYLESQLQAWKSGKRHGDPLDIMQQLSSRMTDAEIHEVAEYYASIRPSQPLPQTITTGALMQLPADKSGAQGEPGQPPGGHGGPGQASASSGK